MKLNKVMALALSGIMAVSMLAGCKGTDGEDSSSTVVTPASDAVSVMNDAQDYVKFEADSEFDAALAAAAKKAKQDDVSKATYSIASAYNDAVYTELGKKLPVGDTMSGNLYDINFSTATGVTANTKTTKNILVLVKNDGLTEKAALEQIVNAHMDADSKYPEIVTDGSNNKYKASYTGKVSIVTVDTSDNGKTAAAYYIAVSVTQTIAREATV